MNRSMVTVVGAVVVAAIIIFSVLAGVRGLISSAQKSQAKAIAAIYRPQEKGGAQ